MMVLTQAPESQTPVLAHVSYDVPRRQRLAVWAAVIAASASTWFGLLALIGALVS